jgi:hypothetical protein
MSLNEDKHVTLERWREALSAWLTALPDFQYHVDLLIAEGDVVAAKTHFAGPHLGVYDFGGWGPTRRSASNSVDTHRSRPPPTDNHVAVRADFVAVGFPESSGRPGRRRTITQIGQHGRNPSVEVCLFREAELGADCVHVLSTADSESTSAAPMAPLVLPCAISLNRSNSLGLSRLTGESATRA